MRLASDLQPKLVARCSSLHAGILPPEEEIELRMDQRNRRRAERQPLSAAVEVSWEDRGRHAVRARLVDLSKQGIQLEMPEALQVRRIAVVRSPELGISANVSVRHCDRAGSHFLVGMEFTGGTYPL